MASRTGQPKTSIKTNFSILINQAVSGIFPHSIAKS